MFEKETFKNRILQLDNNKNLAAAAGVSPGTMSKYLNLEKTNIPTADVLFNIADAYKVSVDWLIGKTSNRIIDDRLKPGDACRALVSICESFPDIQLTKFEQTEECFDGPVYSRSYIAESKTNDYISISFPAWNKIVTDADRYHATQYGNALDDTSRINSFLLGYTNIRDAKVGRDFLTAEEYYQILNERLKEMNDLDERIEHLKEHLTNKESK